jgi:hypothetical protein
MTIEWNEKVGACKLVHPQQAESRAYGNIEGPSQHVAGISVSGSTHHRRRKASQEISRYRNKVLDCIKSRESEKDSFAVESSMIRDGTRLQK